MDLVKIMEREGFYTRVRNLTSDPLKPRPVAHSPLPPSEKPAIVKEGGGSDDRSGDGDSPDAAWAERISAREWIDNWKTSQEAQSGSSEPKAEGETAEEPQEAIDDPVERAILLAESAKSAATDEAVGGTSEREGGAHAPPTRASAGEPPSGDRSEAEARRRRHHGVAPGGAKFGKPMAIEMPTLREVEEIEASLGLQGLRSLVSARGVRGNGL